MTRQAPTRTLAQTGWAGGLDGMFAAGDHSMIEKTPQGISEQIMRLAYVLALTADAEARGFLVGALSQLHQVLSYQVADIDTVRRKASIHIAKA